MAAFAKNSNSSIQFLWSNTNEKSFSRPTTIWIHSLRLFKWVKEFERQEHALVMLEGMFFTVAKLKLYCPWVYNTLVPHQSMWSDSENQSPHWLEISIIWFQEKCLQNWKFQLLQQGIKIIALVKCFGWILRKFRIFKAYLLSKILTINTDSTSISGNGYFNFRRIACI